MARGRRLLGVTMLVAATSMTTLPTPDAAAGSTIKSDEEVVLFTTAAHRDGNHWVVPVHGWIFEPEHDSVWRNSILAGLRAKLKLAASSPERKTFEGRARWFMVDNERGKKLVVQAGGLRSKMNKSHKNGHFRGELRVPTSTSATTLQVRAVTRKGDRRVFKGDVLLVPETGLSIISDIDDTIKITDVHDKKLTMRRTFLEPFVATAGMVERYQKWKREGAVFHYVSASPWHLYVPLRDFMARAGFPTGTMHLRYFRVKSSSRWNLLKSSKPHKLNSIRSLLDRYPKRQFILVGDSGEHDPEIYGTIARERPKQIRAIYIRKTSPSTWSTERHKTAFAGVTASVQMVTDAGRLSAN